MVVNSYDALGYGVHVILDGFRADAASLTDTDAIGEAVSVLATLVDVPSETDRVLIRPGDDGTGGVSAVRLGGESHLCLHTFGSLHKVSLEAFSARALPVQALTEAFVERFAIGRYECRLHARGRRMPRRSPALERALGGDRQYARVRLRDLLAG